MLLAAGAITAVPGRKVLVCRPAHGRAYEVMHESKRLAPQLLLQQAGSQSRHLDTGDGPIGPCGRLVGTCLKHWPKPLRKSPVSTAAPGRSEHPPGQTPRLRRACGGVKLLLTKLRQWEFITEKLILPAGFLSGQVGTKICC